jgi:hypothetical protein
MEQFKEFTINHTRVRDAWLTAMDRGQFPFHVYSDLTTLIREPDWHSRFVGDSANGIAHALRHGVQPDHNPKLNASAFGDQEILVPQIELNEEEGDLLVDQVLGGEDMFYAKWDHVPVNSGARLRILWNTLADSSAACIGAYMDWSLSVIDALTAKGMAPSVELRMLTSHVFPGAQTGAEAADITVKLSEAGRITDSVAWRAFLAPGAFRSLGFLTYAIVADDYGYDLDGGSSMGTDFGVAYDPEEGIVDIMCPARMPRTFPADSMDRMLETVLNKF